MKYRIYQDVIVSEPPFGKWPYPKGDYYVADLHEAIVVSAQRGYKRWFDDEALMFSEKAFEAGIKMEDWRIQQEEPGEGFVPLTIVSGPPYARAWSGWGSFSRTICAGNYYFGANCAGTARNALFKIRSFSPELFVSLPPLIYISEWDHYRTSDFEVYTKPARPEEPGVVIGGKRVRLIVDGEKEIQEKIVPGYVAESVCSIRVFWRGGERVYHFLPGEAWTGTLVCPLLPGRYYYNPDSIEVGDLAPSILDGKVDSLCRW